MGQVAPVADPGCEAEDDAGDDQGDDGEDGYDDSDDRDGSGLLLRKNVSRPDAAAVRAGVSVGSRSFSFSAREGFSNGPAAYQSAIAPGVYIAGEVFPLAFESKRKGILKQFGIGFVLDRVVGLGTTIDGAAGVSLPTTQMQWGVNLRFRHRLGKKFKKSTVHASLGYNHLDFSIDKQSAPAGLDVDLPNTTYSYIDPGVGISVPVTPRLAVSQ